VARRPNYAQERAERQRRKAARRDERVAAKAERRDSPESDAAAVATPETPAPPTAGTPGAAMPADPAAMVRLGQALKFVCGADHPTTLAVQRAAMSAAGNDVERARALFLQLTPGDQRAALTIAAATPSGGR
jgi:sRNA-binding protein